MAHYKPLQVKRTLNPSSGFRVSVSLLPLYSLLILVGQNDKQYSPHYLHMQDGLACLLIHS